MNQPLQLTGEYLPANNHAELVEENRRLRIQVRQLDEALRLERLKEEAAQAGVKELRKILNPLHKALGAVFGEMDAMQLGDEVSSPKSSAVWDSWKSRLGGTSAKIIDALMLHGSMNQTQIAIATGLSRTNMPTYIHKINKAGLIDKNGNEYSLKKL